ncbi:hypothetical protein BJ742DRAFT_713127 [Cladochytrium replicatum]|nr:hypothetical protein BJ742DRAFT_713127 [Cladochytrium replicatum]
MLQAKTMRSSHIEFRILKIFPLLCMIFAAYPVTGSWLSCPSSFIPFIPRAENFNGPCDLTSGSVPVTLVGAGQNLKVGWPSLNRGGGFVRLALAPLGSATENTFISNVLKITCYGVDPRAGGTSNGACVHPCFARPGCQWQFNKADTERYDVTLTMPTNLVDGLYVLQYAGLLSGSTPTSITYSCALLNITGGNPALPCAAPSEIPAPKNCILFGGDNRQRLVSGAKAGAFCFNSAGGGTVDDNIFGPPINRNCDPRVSCDLSSDPSTCANRDGGIQIPVPSNPIVSCEQTRTGSPSVSSTSRSSTRTNTKSTTKTTNTKTTKTKSTGTKSTKTNSTRTKTSKTKSTRTKSRKSKRDQETQTLRPRQADQFTPLPLTFVTISLPKNGGSLTARTNSFTPQPLSFISVSLPGQSETTRSSSGSTTVIDPTQINFLKRGLSPASGTATITSSSASDRPTVSTCVRDGQITNHAAFCRDWSRVCEQICGSAPIFLEEV